MPKTTPRNQRRSTRSQRRPKRKSTTMPAVMTLFSHYIRTVVQTIWDVYQGSVKIHPSAPLYHGTTASSFTTTTPMPTSWNSGDMKDEWILAQGWKDRFAGLFYELKIHRITIHYLPYASVNQVGEYVFALWDTNQNYDPKSASEAVGIPASVVRPMRQASKLEWIPTEPEDKNWHKFGDGHTWCRAAIFAVESVYKVPLETQEKSPSIDIGVGTSLANIAGKIVVEVQLSARGKPKKPTIGLSSMSPFSGSTPHCCCRKCLQGSNIFDDTFRAPSSPFERLDLAASPYGELRG